MKALISQAMVGTAGIWAILSLTPLVLTQCSSERTARSPERDAYAEIRSAVKVMALAVIEESRTREEGRESSHDTDAARLRGVELRHESGKESLQQAITHLRTFLTHQYDPSALIEVAYCFSALADLQVNAELNLLRSEGILDALGEVMEDDDRKTKLEHSSLRIINGLRKGKMTAEDAQEYLKNMWEAGQTNPMFLEAQYLADGNWKARREIADMLIKHSPRNARYHYYKGLAYYFDGDEVQALMSFLAAATYGEKFTPAANNLAALRKGESPVFHRTVRFGREWEPEPYDFPFSAFRIFAHRAGKKVALQLESTEDGSEDSQP